MTVTTPSQISFPELCPVTEAVASLAAAPKEERGAIFTRREVVEFILDITGYTPDKPLYQYRILEPAFGDGDFLLPVIERLLQSRETNTTHEATSAELQNSLRAVELNAASYQSTHNKVVNALSQHGLCKHESEQLANTWLLQGDFLLEDFADGFDYVVGNPPYIRQELLPAPLIAEYRSRYKTVFDRADIYIPFIERSLSLLNNNGALGFICSDRWMKNRYGGPLRKMVTENFHLKYHVDMTDTAAFHSEVIAYPAITVIASGSVGKTRIASRPAVEQSALRTLATALTSSAANNTVKELSNIAKGEQPWILEASDQLQLVRRLEQDFPTLEETGCKVGIGVATGADKVFIAPYDDLDVEESCKLPLVMTRDIARGDIDWRGLGVVNPFDEDGRLVNLAQHPKLKHYLETHRDVIAARHVAKKTPANWYRTIDKIHPALTHRPKLLIPDIKGDAHIVYEAGNYYPHHNLYYITSDQWDLHALQAVLQSGIAKLFISTYSTRMRGGYLRFQAQYLRRIRLPHWQSLPDTQKANLIGAVGADDPEQRNEAVFDLYGLTQGERAAIRNIGG